jgi:16S rRNA (cytosine1402-N4)-methyltransferase
MQGIKTQDSARLHRSILVSECLDALNVARGGTYLDLTFGEGGHTEAILAGGADRVIAFDQDAQTIARYQEHGALKGDPRLTLIHSRFSEIGAYVPPDSVEGILIDLGVSTRQLLMPERGFSFSGEGPLDMRMDPSRGMPLTAWLEKLSVPDLAFNLGRNTDMKGAYSAANRILEAFHTGRLQTTKDLGALFDRPGTKMHAGTVVFLGLRMMVNDEMGEAERVIPQALDALKLGGRLAVITFHSTEDRVVKRAMKILTGQCICEKPICRCPRVRRGELIFRKPLVPGEDELRANPRARSAKLRCIEKVAPDT